MPMPVGGGPKPPALLGGGIMDGGAGAAGTGTPLAVEKNVTPAGFPMVPGAGEAAGGAGAP
jgi:hypothetical protein